MSESENDGGSRRITIELPIEFIDHLDELKREWGVRARGDILKRLLEEVLPDNKQLNVSDSHISVNDKQIKDDAQKIINQSLYNESTALVLISNSNKEKSNNEDYNINNNKEIRSTNNNSKHGNLKGIDLPGFVSKNATKLRNSLESRHRESSFINDGVIKTVSKEHISKAQNEAINHWLSLYGNKPKENVVEAAMLWLARDIWPNLENTEALSFTWTLANRMVRDYCPDWTEKIPTLERIIVIAGVLEDPFSSNTLTTRIPTLIRRFVNRFKRNQNVTSFQTLESTMTVHGALKLLDLPTTAGALLTLSRIRDSYKIKALSVHPDSGGSTESMRRVNEAYQLLKDLYKNDS